MLAPAAVLDYGLRYTSHYSQCGSIYSHRDLHDHSLYVGLQNTKGSLLVAILLHTSFDVLVGPVGLLFPAPVVTSYGGAVPLLISLGVTALLVTLTRGRLGYRNYRQGDRDRSTAPT